MNISKSSSISDNHDTQVLSSNSGIVKPSPKFARRLDAVATHPAWGLLLFLSIMATTFFLTFFLGKYPAAFIEYLFASVSGGISHALPDGTLKELFRDGILTGVSGVAVFIPNIMLLFSLLSLMEKSGYMARGALVIDRIMHKLGLHGTSFLPLIMGFGCNVPAIMATRSIRNKNNRIVTILIIPFMSCGAKLPVYVLFITAFFPGWPGTMLFLLYFIGLAAAILSTLLLKKFILPGTGTERAQSLPPYALPGLAPTLRYMWQMVFEYIKKIASVVLIASILIWAFGKYPRDEAAERRYLARRASIQTRYAQLEIGKTPLSAPVRLQKEKALNNLDSDHRRKVLEYSLIGRMGHSITPFFAPLGFNWQMSASLLSGLAAKEIIVSTMSILYQTGTTRFDPRAPASGAISSNFNHASAAAFMIFVLLYFPCFGALTAIKKESGSWRWAFLAAVYTTGLAWIVSFFVYTLTSALS